MNGITVLDVTTNIAGPYSTYILGSMGATIWKIERPDGGDDARQMYPVVGGHSAYFDAINIGKKSLALDLKLPEGKEIIRRLARMSDVFVENFRPGVANKLGLSFRELRKLNSKIVYGSISGYGQKGSEFSKPGYDALLQARTGLMSVSGWSDGPPTRVGVSILDMTTGLWLTLAITTALYERTLTGKGKYVSASLFETGISFLAYHLAYKQLTNELPLPQGSDHLAFAPYGAYRVHGDKYIFIGVSNDRQFRRLAQALGHEEWLERPHFQTNLDRVKNKEILRNEIEKALRDSNTKSCEQLLSSRDIPVSRLQNVNEVLHDPQAEELSLFQVVAGPNGTNMRLPRLPLSKVSRGKEEPVKAPLLGADTRKILLQAGYSQSQIKSLADKKIVSLDHP